MSNNLTWIFLLIVQCTLATSRPMPLRQDTTDENHRQTYHYNNAPNIPKYDDSTNPLDDEKVISVRITSSVAVGRGKGKLPNSAPNSDHGTTRRHHELNEQTTTPAPTTILVAAISTINDEDTENSMTELPPSLIGANIEFIKQLNAKKEFREHHSEKLHPYQKDIKNEHKEDTSTKSEFEDLTIGTEDDLDIPLARNIPLSYYSNQLKDWKNIHNFHSAQTHYNQYNESMNTVKSVKDYIPESNNKEDLSLILDYETTEAFIPEDYTHETYTGNHDNNETDDSIAESSIKSVQKLSDEDQGNNENIDNVALARSVPLSPPSQNYVQGLTTHNKSLRAGGNGARLTTVSFNIVHDTPNTPTNYNEPTNTYIPSQTLTAQLKNYQPQIFSEPAKIYSEPAKIYSEPAKIYSEPAKIYSEPAKIYSEPAKIYSEPAKFYSEPASLHLPANAAPQTPWKHQSQNPISTFSTTTIITTPLPSVTNPAHFTGNHRIPEHQPEKNYEVDENQSVVSNGRTHGVQESSTEKCKQDNCKVGYVVEGRQYKKYRVEERTPDGFIVGEYGVVRNEDGALRGVRYTADSDASPRLIYDALMKFLQLK